MLAQALLALATGALGALVFSAAHLPVPWLLGSISGCALAAVALYVVVVTATLYWFLRRFAGFDPVTAYFSAAPGGFMAMTVIGGAFGGQMRNIVPAHSIRLVVAVFTLVTAYHVAPGAEPAFVTFHNLFRVILILLAGPVVFRWTRRRPGAGARPADR